MFDFFEKILIGFIIMCLVFLFAFYVIIFYKDATNDKNFFAHKVYIVNQDSCKDVK